jgi:uncharacterized Tic20 family protein
VVGSGVELLLSLKLIAKESQMKKLSYLLLMAFGFYGATTAVAVTRNWNNLGSFYSLFQFFALISQFIGPLLIYRIYLFIKHRSIIVPEEYSGGIATFSYLCLAFPVIVFGGYVVIALVGGGNGLSGIPLGVALYISATLCALAYFVCETRAIVAALANRNSAK